MSVPSNLSLTSAFDGSEDHMVAFKLMDLVGTDMKAVREDN